MLVSLFLCNHLLQPDILLSYGFASIYFSPPCHVYQCKEPFLAFLCGVVVMHIPVGFYSQSLYGV